MTDIKVKIKLNDNNEILSLDNLWNKDINSVSQTTAQNDSISYGGISNSGSLDIHDVNGQIKEYINSGIIDTSNIPLVIVANGKEVQTHIGKNANYNTNSETFTVDLTNSLENWNEVRFVGFPYKEGGDNAYNMLLYVFGSVGFTTEQVDEMLSHKIVFGIENYYNTIKNYLTRIFIPYAYLPSATLRETIDKFCTLAQLHVYKDDNDKIKFVSARPVESSSRQNDIILIGKKNIIGDYEKDIIVKNKYDVVNVEETVVEDNIEYGSLIGKFATDNIQTDFNIETDFAEKTENSYNVGTGITYSVAYVSVLGEYLNSSMSIPKKSNFNLEQINSILFGKDENGEDNIKCTITYVPYTSNATATCKFQNSIGSKNASVSNIRKGVLSSGQQTSTEKFDLNASHSNTFSGVKATAQIVEGVDIQNYTNLSTISLGDMFNGIVDNGDSYTYYFKVLAHKEIVKLGFGEFNSSGSGTYTNDMVGTRELLRAVQIEINFYGNKRIISFNNFQNINNDSDSSKNTISIAGNELLQPGTIFDNSTKMSEIIAENIKNDYASGVKTGAIKSPCINMYNLSGEMIKDWSQGEILQSADLLYTEKDGELWRITGRTFLKNGVPLVQSQLQEIVNLIDTSQQKSCTLTLPADIPYVSYDIVGDDGTKYNSSGQIPYGSLITVNVSIKSSFTNNARIKHIYLNGIEIKNGATTTVLEDLVLTFNFDSITNKQKVISIDNNGSYTISYNAENYDVSGEVSVQYVSDYDEEGQEILSGSSQPTSRFVDLGEEYKEGYYSNSNNGSFDILINKNYCMLTVPSVAHPTNSSVVGKYIGVEYNVWQNYNSTDFT